MFKFNPFKSMTIQGTVAALAPMLLNSFNPGALSPTATGIVTTIGVLWSVLGLRNAVGKHAGQAVADLTEQMIRRAGGGR